MWFLCDWLYASTTFFARLLLVLRAHIVKLAPLSGFAVWLTVGAAVWLDAGADVPPQPASNAPTKTLAMSFLRRERTVPTVTILPTNSPARNRPPASPGTFPDNVRHHTTC
jgi:hypothetical protein